MTRRDTKIKSARIASLPVRAGRAATAFFGAIALLAATLPAGACEPGSWYWPGGAARVTARQVIAHAARHEVVLLGESHDDAEHHLWQLQTLAALHVERAHMAIGFEAFPRRVQPVLDEWIAGKLTEEEFLERAEWKKFWKLPADLYRPLFQFARLNRIPMVALNVDRPLKDAPISRPAPAVDAYEEHLFEAFKQHAKGKTAARGDAAFRRFVDAQLTWDRAMAEGLTARLRGSVEPHPLVVGIAGAGHVRYGHGIAHQLQHLGVTRVVALLPVRRSECVKLDGQVADAVFVLPDRP